MEKKIYYFPDSEHCDTFFGPGECVCVDYQELNRLAKGWNINLSELMVQVHEASEAEIKEYGVYDSEEV